MRVASTEAARTFFQPIISALTKGRACPPLADSGLRRRLCYT